MLSAGAAGGVFSERVVQVGDTEEITMVTAAGGSVHTHQTVVTALLALPADRACGAAYGCSGMPRWRAGNPDISCNWRSDCTRMFQDASIAIASKKVMSTSRTLTRDFP